MTPPYTRANNGRAGSGDQDSSPSAGRPLKRGERSVAMRVYVRPSIRDSYREIAQSQGCPVNELTEEALEWWLISRKRSDDK